jgi:hypothetical protein
MSVIYEGLGSAATTRKHYAPHCPTPEENADMDSAMASREYFSLRVWALIISARVQGREKHVAEVAIARTWGFH